VNYFSNEDRFKHLIKSTDKLEILSDKMLLVCGDFYGIQKFIFDRLATKNASKVLRAKSAFVQIFTEYLATYICKELNVGEEHILSKNAGKFEILIPYQNIDLESIQKKIDTYFIDKFYGLSGVLLLVEACSKEEFLEPKKYQAFRRRVLHNLEKEGFKKFDLSKQKESVISTYDTSVNNETLCPVCHIRQRAKTNTEYEETCGLCDGFVTLGQKLSSKYRNQYITPKEIGIDFDPQFNPKIKLTEALQSYVLFPEGEKSPADFKVLAENSSTDLNSLAILKADVDNMGAFLENELYDVTDSYENFESFSETINNFFSLYIPELMATEYKNTYIVFAGGDDLFLLGAWDEVLNLARKIREEFKTFVKVKGLSISFGIAIAKPTTPISYLATHTEELLDEAKALCMYKENAKWLRVKNSQISGSKKEYCEALSNQHEVSQKDAICLFGETERWDEYQAIFSKLEDTFTGFEVVNTATLYTLLTLCDMSKNIHKDIRNTLWKSKLNDLFSRNIDRKYHHILEVLNESIEQSPRASKMFLSEFIYKERKKSRNGK